MIGTGLAFSNWLLGSDAGRVFYAAWLALVAVVIVMSRTARP